MDIFIFFALSPKVYELQRCIIPHFKALDLSFWHFRVNFGSRIEDFSTIKQQMCLICFGSDFSLFAEILSSIPGFFNNKS